jgi:hypothetical protein
MPFLMTHFYPGGTHEQYAVVLNAVHPDSQLPAGQLSSAAGPCDGGWLISAVWESREAFEIFVAERLMPALSIMVGGFATAPEEHLSELTLYQTV